MEINHLKEIVEEVKKIADAHYTPYEVLVSVLRQLDDNESRMKNVVGKPGVMNK
ncbi:hypothetical protein OMZ99_001050 [Escherichia coli]|nr:hypothetical protein [Escherichia coli]HBD4590970.1 hypothetical protein [Shigella sonnei]HBD6759235.1 hypothetical protein [Shigella sonnei]HCM8577959.1 hypothetical protein [Shigella boydii]